MKKNKEKQEIKVLELFAGVGGFRLGLERASKLFRTVYSNQWEPGRTKQWAYECYIRHFSKSANNINADINLVKHSVANHDLLVGGFPCQDYSVAHGNNAKGIEGKKGVLWWDIIDIISDKKPSLILLENVDRLIRSPSKQRGRDFGIMLKTLSEQGYNAEWRIINAADYGFYQRRRRIFIFAYKASAYKNLFKDSNLNDLITSNGFFADIFPIQEVNEKKGKTIVSITENKFKDLLEFSDSFYATFFNSGVLVNGEILSIHVNPKIEKVAALSKIVETGEVNERYFLNGSTKQIEYLKSNKKVPRINPNGDIYFYSEGQMLFPDPMDRPARTMLTSESTINRSTHVIKDVKTGKLRFLTPLECERLNGFDDNWTDTGMPDKFRYFCMGNALVVPLVTIMGKKIVKLWRIINE